MSLDADLIVDRRRMRRKLTFWRVLAIAVIVIAIIGIAGARWVSRPPEDVVRRTVHKGLEWDVCAIDDPGVDSDRLHGLGSSRRYDLLLRA